MDISAGPLLIITEEETPENITTEQDIKDVLDDLIKEIVNSIAEPRKRKLSEEVQQQTFSIGVFSGYLGNANKRRKRDTKQEKYKNIKNRKPVKTKLITNRKPAPIIKEDPAIKHARILRLFTLTNPYYTNHLIFKKILLELNDPVCNFSGKRHPHIYLIIPIRKPRYMPYVSAYLYLRYFSGSIFDWQLKLKEIVSLKSVFPYDDKEFKFYVPPSQQYGPSKYFTRAANEIYDTNQRLRWNFKRLLNRWLIKRSNKRTVDSDLITMEPVPEDDQIRIYCIKSRSLYVFNGNSLLKMVKSALESQQGSICNPKQPKNPFTNVPFTYAQMIKVSKELLNWCAKKSIRFPAIISVYAESRYSLMNLMSLHNNFLQYHATRNYMFNDDIHGAFFLENLEVLVDTFSPFLAKYAQYEDIEIFRAWFEDEKDHPLIRCWRHLVCDYWHYKQTEHLIRSSWQTEMSIVVDIEILFKASESKLRQYI